MVAEHKIENFIGKVNMGVEWFQDAGKMLVAMLDAYPGVKEDIMAYRRGWITLDVLNTFELIGRKQLAVEAMFLPRHVLNRLIELPVGQQVNIATKMIPVVTGYRQGRPHVVDKHASDLTRRESGRVIGPSGVRTVSAQSVMLDNQRKFESMGVYDLTANDDCTFKLTKSTRSRKSHVCQQIRLTDGIAEIELVRAVLLTTEKEKNNGKT
jgi:hypothetical protein